jgi:hypothetical protein
LTDIFLTLRSCAVFKLHRGGLANFRWRIARGRHLFPFRTEQLSLSAPMVLGGQPPGRVGRRRFFDFGPPRGAALRRSGADREAAIANPTPRARTGRLRAAAGLAARRGSPNGLQPVLAERREVDQQVDGVGQPSCECRLRVEHGFVSYGGLRTALGICNGACRSCLGSDSAASMGRRGALAPEARLRERAQAMLRFRTMMFCRRSVP